MGKKERMMNQETSKTLYRLKAFALVAIVMAHTYYTEIPNEWAVRYIHRFCTAGVFCFFFLSGFFFHPTKGQAAAFIRKKISSLVCPWFFCSSLYFALLVVTHTMSPNLKHYINFVLGNGSFLYYLTVLCIFYLLFWHFSQNRAVLLLSILLSVFSTVLTGREVLPGLVDPDKWIFTYLNPYLNIFNWIGIFSLGVLFQENMYMEKTLQTVGKRWWAFTIGAFLSVLVLTPFDNNDGYWSNFSLILEAVIVLGLLGLACGMGNKKVSMSLETIGRLTLPVYLLHMPIQNRILASPSMRGSVVCAVLRPVITICLIAGIMTVFRKLLRYLPEKLESVACTVFGLK